MIAVLQFYSQVFLVNVCIIRWCISLWGSIAGYSLNGLLGLRNTASLLVECIAKDVDVFVLFIQQKSASLITM